MNYYLAKDPARSRTIDYALPSHATLACRGGIVDRKYVETLRQMAYAKHSVEDIAFLNGLGPAIDKLGGVTKGGLDDFVAQVKEDSALQTLRRDIAMRIKALAAQNR